MSAAKKVILLVDDNAAQLELLAEQLTEKGYEVLSAGSQKEAEQLIEEKSFDLALLDLTMEHKDSGFILSYRIKRKEASKPVIILSSKVHELNLQHQMTENEWLKADAVIQKGVRLDLLLAEIARLIQ